MIKQRIVEAVGRIAADRLSPAMREEIADCAIKIIKDSNREVALAFMEQHKQTIQR